MLPARKTPTKLSELAEHRELSIDNTLRSPAQCFGSVGNSSLTIAMSRAIELKENTTIVVLGASGDLAKKKTVRPSSLILT